jgi:predicted secreted protein
VRRLAPLLVVIVSLGVPSAASAATRTLGADDSGKTITLARGDRLRIELDVCPGCGYHWELRRKPSRHVLRRLKQRSHGTGCADPPPGEPPCVGGTYVTIYRWAAHGAGVTRLRLASIPPGQQPPDQVLRFRVRVR